MALIAVLAALASTCGFAVSTSLQHRAVTVSTRRTGNLFSSLARNPSWFLGLLVGALAFTFHAVAVKHGALADVAAARDESVARRLAMYPAVVGYLRRAVLYQTGYRGRVLELLTNLAAEQVASLRDAGVASTAQRDSSQVIGLMVRQLGQLFLQPMVDSMWQQLSGPSVTKDRRPEIVVRVQVAAGPV